MAKFCLAIDDSFSVLIDDDAYASIVADMTAAINSYASSIVDFELSGTCSTDDCINSANEWYTGCCNWS